MWLGAPQPAITLILIACWTHQRCQLHWPPECFVFLTNVIVFLSEPDTQAPPCLLPAHCRSPHLLWLPEQWAYLQSFIQAAYALGGIPIHTVGIIPSSNQHGAQQHAEVKAVPSLVLQDGGWGIE